MRPILKAHNNMAKQTNDEDKSNWPDHAFDDPVEWLYWQMERYPTAAADDISDLCVNLERSALWESYFTIVKSWCHRRCWEGGGVIRMLALEILCSFMGRNHASCTVRNEAVKSMCDLGYS